MEELLSCSVCCEQYQEKHRHPVVLPRCGHSFCRPCVAFLVKNGCVICPSCRMDQRVETADHLPTEFSLLAITNAQRVTKMETCSRHDVKLSFWCRTCSTPACGECLFEEHPTHRHRIVKATTYVEDMKVAVKDIAAKFADALDLRERWHHQQVFQAAKAISDAIRTLSILRRDIDDARELVKGVHVVEGIGPTTALSEASKCLGLKWNLKGCHLELTDASGRQQVSGEGMGDGEGRVKEVDKEEEEEEEGKVSKEKNEAEKEPPAEAPAEEVEKTDDEKKPDAEEKEIDELEALTEEERKKRKKILRLKEKLAAASAAAEKKDAANRDKDKVDLKHKTDRRSSKEKGEKEAEAKKDNDPESAKPLAADKTQRTSRKHAPASRESSTSPPRDVAPSKDGHTTSKSDLEEETENDATKKTRKEGDSDSNKASQSSFPARIEPLPKSKPDAVSALKKPRSHTGLKKSKTVTFMTPPEDTAADDAKDDHSEDIRGLDLQVPRVCRVDDLDNKEKGQEEAGDVETPQREERQNKKREKKESKKNNTKEKVFEMEPEEKERIATELMQVPSLTLVVEGIGGRLAYVTWESIGLHVYCHQYQELPYDLLVKSSLLLSLLPTKTPLVFLDIGTELRVLGRVYISLWGHLRRAMNFLHLCLGDRGPSFKDSMFLDVMNADCPGERIHGGDYECNNGRGGEALLDNLEADEGYSMPMEAGMITAGGPNRKEVDSQFFICTEDDFDRRFACPFGRVVSGLPVMKEAVWLVMTKEVYIRDCGVVVEAPRI